MPVQVRSGQLKKEKIITSYDKLKRWRRQTKLRALAYKGYCCIVCGFDSFESALSFHHLNPEEKEFNISTSKRNSWRKIQSELDKCVLVCLNCHSGIHSDDINIEDYLHKRISQEEAETNLKKVYPVWRNDAYRCLECGEKLTQITQKYCSEHK